MHYPEPISKLIDSFMKLPGIGPKTAGRLAFFVLSMKEDTVLDFAKALVDAKRNFVFVQFAVILRISILVIFARINSVTDRRFVSCKIRKMSLLWKK